MVLEFQNSALSPDELDAREAFYGRMLWIVNARRFKEDLAIGDELPDPKDPLSQDVVIAEHLTKAQGSAFWRRSTLRVESGLVQLHRIDLIRDQIMRSYNGYHLFHWRRPRRIWLNARHPVFLDIGAKHLLRLRRHPCATRPTVQLVLASALVEKNGGLFSALHEA